MSKRPSGTTKLALAACILGTGATLTHAVDPIFSAGSLAIRGYDPVAYFIGSKPVKGKKQFEHDWNGATWRFASAEHRDRFAGDPARYAPQYGGYCAYAVSQGSTASTDPKAWTIVGDKLYLNYSLAVRKRWSQDIPGNIAKADANWPRLLAGD